MTIPRKLTTEDEIKESIVSNLALIFGESKAVDPRTFREKYNSLVENAGAVSAPFLGPETIRYQTMLLSLSVLFISISLFRIGGIKIGDTVVSVDSKLLVIYAVLIFLVIVIFLIKARLDFQRALFVRERNANTTSELRELIGLGMLMKRIQEYFWLEISDAIGRSYKTYDEASRATLNQPSEFTHISMQVVNLDRPGLNKIAETKAELARLDAYLTSFVAEVADDEELLRQECVDILSAVPDNSDDPYLAFRDNRYERIRTAFDGSLGKWFSARNALIDKHLDVVMENLQGDEAVHQLQAMVKILKRTRTIQNVYASIEIFAPVLFAIFSILYVRFG